MLKFLHTESVITITTTITKITLVESTGNGYTTIPLKFETKERLAASMPKHWDWDRCIAELTQMWENHQGKVVKSGKPSSDNQAS